MERVGSRRMKRIKYWSIFWYLAGGKGVPSKAVSLFKYELGAHSVKIYTAGTMNIDKLGTLDGEFSINFSF